MKLFILDTNERLNIDKSKKTLVEVAEKLKEESKELVEALHCTDLEHIAEEALDVIQVTMNLLDRLESKDLSIEKQINLHNMKLIGRGWGLKKMLEVREI